MNEVTIYASRREVGDGVPSRFTFVPRLGNGGTPADPPPRQWFVSAPWYWALSTDHRTDIPMLLVGWVAGAGRRLSASRVLELAQRHEHGFHFAAARD